MFVEFAKVIIIKVVVHVVEGASAAVRLGRTGGSTLLDSAAIGGNVGVHNPIAIVLGIGSTLEETKEEFGTLFVDGASLAFARVGDGRGRGAYGGGGGGDGRGGCSVVVVIIVVVVASSSS